MEKIRVIPRKIKVIKMWDFSEETTYYFGEKGEDEFD